MKTTTIKEMKNKLKELIRGIDEIESAISEMYATGTDAQTILDYSFDQAVNCKYNLQDAYNALEDIENNKLPF